MTATLNDDPDLCMYCGQHPATVMGFCSRCMPESPWFVDRHN
jgi:hypothetical protein